MHSLRLRFIVVFGLFILISSSAMAVFSALSIVKTGVTLCSEQGLPIAQKADEIIDGDKFEALALNPSVNDPYYEEARLALLNIKETINCHYLYTMAPVGGTIYKYIIDGSCDPSDTENFSELGTHEDIADYGEGPLLAMADGGFHSSGLEKQEQWGYTISTYKGIKNSRRKVVGFIGVDFNVETILQMLKRRIVSIAIVSTARMKLTKPILNTADVSLLSFDAPEYLPDKTSDKKSDELSERVFPSAFFTVLSSDTLTDSDRGEVSDR